MGGLLSVTSLSETVLIGKVKEPIMPVAGNILIVSCSLRDILTAGSLLLNRKGLLGVLP
jgi:hypothetical protein